LEVIIAQDREILMKSTTLMMRYYKNKEMVNTTIVSGYLHTGDIDEIDADGFLTIADRIKKCLKLLAKNIVLPQF
jgi:long-chain acyl-CoA synthetase